MKGLTIIVLTLVFMGVVGCTANSDAHSESLVTRLEHDSTHAEPAQIDITELLVEYQTVEVETDSEPSFHVLARTDEIEKYPCASCHETPLDETLSAEIDPHWDIIPNHASTDVMSCVTCHGTENFDTLYTLADTPVEFDHSYQVCAQCHDPQYDDWLGGAHGKRLEGWAEPRVIENCVGCHNPHDPAWDKRWPAVTGGGIGEQ